MARKSGKDLRKEYRNLLDKTKAMQKRLYKRAAELIAQYPDVVYWKRSEGEDITVSQYNKFYRMTPMNAISMIETIEQWIADQHPHQQGNLFVDAETCNCKPEDRDMPTYEEDGKRWCPQCGLEVK